MTNLRVKAEKKKEQNLISHSEKKRRKKKKEEIKAMAKRLLFERF